MSPFIGRTANPEELAIMTEALNSHCLQHKIVDETAKFITAHSVLLLFDGGAKTVEELTAGLKRVRAS
jgi:hypothetical protein